MNSIRPYKGLGYSIESWGGSGRRPYSVDIYPKPDGGRPIARTPVGVSIDTVAAAAQWAKDKINEIKSASNYT